MAKFFEVKNSKRNSYRSNKSAVQRLEGNSQRVEALSITRLSDDGRGIGSYKGKTVFIGNALPGENVDADITFDKSNYGEGLATIIHQASMSRRLPQCEYFNQCGGCHLQHLDAREQQTLKLNNVLNKLKHVSHITPEKILPMLSGDAFYYRQRARLSVVYEKKEVLFGFRKKNSKEIINIKECHVILAEFNQLIEPLRDWLTKHKPSVTHIEFTGKGESVGIVIRHTKHIDVPIRKRLNEKLTKYGVACWFQEQKAGVLTDANSFLVDPEQSYSLQVKLETETKEVSFLYHPQDFIQTNALVNNKMVNRAIDFLRPEKNHALLDLFCGSGNFSIPLSLLCESIIGIEGSDKMVAKAIKNAKINDCDNVSFSASDLFDEAIVTRLFDNMSSKKIDAIVLDPPRAGAKTICQNIKRIQPHKILYISCEPNTLARDAKLLADNGYMLKKMSTMDMFPQTYHNEVISLFVLNKKYAAALTKKEFN